MGGCLYSLAVAFYRGADHGESISGAPTKDPRGGEPPGALATLVSGALLGIGGFFLAYPGHAARAFGARGDGRETFALHYATGARTATLGLTVLALARSRQNVALGIVSTIAALNAAADAVIAAVDSGAGVRAGARHLPGVLVTSTLGWRLLRQPRTPEVADVA